MSFRARRRAGTQLNHRKGHKSTGSEEHTNDPTQVLHRDSTLMGAEHWLQSRGPGQSSAVCSVPPQIMGHCYLSTSASWSSRYSNLCHSRIYTPDWVWRWRPWIWRQPGPHYLLGRGSSSSKPELCPLQSWFQEQILLYFSFQVSLSSVFKMFQFVIKLNANQSILREHVYPPDWLASQAWKHTAVGAVRDQTVACQTWV